MASTLPHIVELMKMVPLGKSFIATIAQRRLL